MITTRVLSPLDAQLWRDLRLDGIKTFPNAFLASQEEAQSIPLAVDQSQMAAGTRYAAFDGATPIGIAGINPHTLARAAHRAEIGPFYVVPDAQGTGAARALMQALLDHATANGIWQLDLTVAETNHRAIAFYERFGFERMGRIPNSIIGSNGPEDDAFYVLVLPHGS